MNETQREQIKGALLKCAEENENKVTPTFCVVVSSVCKSAAERIAELEAQIEKMQCCENCNRYKPCITCNETIGNNCDYYSGGNVCNNWKLN